MTPTLGNGKICYLEIPAEDVARSAGFYSTVFNWQLRKRAGGSIAFDDGVNQVSGTWALDRPPAADPGLLVYLMVDDIETAIRLVVANGGTIVQPVGMDAPEVTARFQDPYGNVLGLYHEP